ncbi:MAG: RdgB/HAM1 family non-canonical purine NTP pyrophosphatase [Candidatus Ancillula sp.]|nr:RdgB/HAM1 family non-canonical purine NTP pyrophosphatase [Candidatus Ancillula sp.]
MPPKLLLATNNAKKLSEIQGILEERLGGDLTGQIVNAATFDLPEPVEDGATFEENALIKAQYYFDKTGIPALADDSGLIVDLLGNAPGVLSARWSGVHGDDLGNNRLLLRQLEDVPCRLRGAHFTTCCALVGLVRAQEHTTTFGEMRGRIIHEMRGENGFGYDSIFVPDAFEDTELEGKTTAEVTPEMKQKISHRSQAVSAMVKHLVELF